MLFPFPLRRLFGFGKTSPIINDISTGGREMGMPKKGPIIGRIWGNLIHLITGESRSERKVPRTPESARWIGAFLEAFADILPRLSKNLIRDRYRRKTLRVGSIEVLEDRTVPAVITWDGGAGTNNWSDAANWSFDRFPTNSDDVIIGSSFAGQTIKSNSDVTISSVTSAASLALEGGTFDVSGDVGVSSGADFVLSGGTLKNATVIAQTHLLLTPNGGTLSGVTTAADLDLETKNGANVVIENGLTLGNATVRIGDRAGNSFAQLLFRGNQTLGGTGAVVFGSQYTNRITAGGTINRSSPGNPQFTDIFTIGAGVTIRGNTGSIKEDPNYPLSKIVNLGTIQADASTPHDTDLGYDRLITDFSNSQVFSTGNTPIDTSSVTNPLPESAYRTYRQAFSDYYYGGFTYNLPGLNAGATYRVRLHFAESSHNSNFNVDLNEGRVLNNFSIQDAAGGLNKAVVREFNTKADANGVITAFFGSSAIINGIEVYSGDTRVLVVDSGPGVGAITINPSTIENKGTIAASNGDSLYVQGLTGNVGNSLVGPGSTLSLGGSFTVTAPLSAPANSTLSLSGPWTNTSTITATNATLSLGASIIGGNSSPTPWSNLGSITANASTVNLGGAFTMAGLGSFAYPASKINLTGLLDNSDRTLKLDATTGSWSLLGGKIKGGRYEATDGSSLLFTPAGGTLSGLTVGSDLDLQNYATVAVENGLTLDHVTMRIGDRLGISFGNLYFRGNQTLGGTGTVIFGARAGYYYSNNTITVGGNTELHSPGTPQFTDTFTIDSGITIRGNSGSISEDPNYPLSKIVNLGTIHADASTPHDTDLAYDRYLTDDQASEAYFTDATIDTSAVANPLPESAYRSFRQASNWYEGFSYVLPGLNAGSTYRVRLHFAEIVHYANFDVDLNGTTVLNNFSIQDAAGGLFKAVVREFNATADANGSITAEFGPLGIINAIEVYSEDTRVLTVDNGTGVGAIAINSTTFENKGAIAASNGESLYLRGLMGNVGNITLSQGSSLSLDGKYKIEAPMVVQDNSTLSLYGSWTNTSTINATNATLTLGDHYDYGSNSSPSQWSNLGSITASASTVNLGGSFSMEGLGSFTHPASKTYLTGLLDNTDRTLRLDANTGSLYMSGGKIQGGRYEATDGSSLLFTQAGGTLSGLTAVSDLELQDDASVKVENGLTLDHVTVRIGDRFGGSVGWMSFRGNQTLGGTGTIIFGAGSGGYYSKNTISVEGTTDTNSPPTDIFTIGSGITIRGNSGAIQGDYYYPISKIVNLGTIQADASPIHDTDLGYDRYLTETNTSQIYFTGETPIDTSAVTNPLPESAYRSYRQARWYDGFSYLLPGLNPGSTYRVRLHFAESSHDSNFDVDLNGERVLDNFSIQDAAGGLNKAVVREFNATADANGSITADFGPYGIINAIEVYSDDTRVLAVDSGPGVGTITINSSTFENKGTIASTNGESLVVQGLTGIVGNAILGSGSNLTLAGSFTVAAPLSAPAESTLSISGTWTNTSTITATNATVSLGESIEVIGDPSSWKNSGSISAVSSMVDLGGVFTTPDLGTVTFSNSKVNLTGLLDNTDQTLKLDANTGSWSMSGGKIKGGRYEATGGSSLLFTKNGGTLSGVIAGSDLDLETNFSANVEVENGLTLDHATVRIGDRIGNNRGTMLFKGNQTLGGTGTVIFGSNPSNQISVQGNTYRYSGGNPQFNDIFTVGSGITIRGNSGSIAENFYYPLSKIVNLGAILADATSPHEADLGYDRFITEGYSWEGETGDTLIDTSGMTSPLPESAYRTFRQGNDFAYTLPSLKPGSTYRVRLHFAEESHWSNLAVDLNGTRVLDDFSIVDAAGGFNKAVVREFDATADASGSIKAKFHNGTINAIEVYSEDTRVLAIDCGPRAGTLTIDSGAFENKGSIAVSNGGSVKVTAEWQNSGNLSVSDGNFDPGSLTATSGIVTIGAGGVFPIRGDYWQIGGETRLLGGTLDATGTARIDAGILSGFGIISGDLVNSGTILPGGQGAIGQLFVAGKFTQTSKGVLDVELHQALPMSGTSSLEENFEGDNKAYTLSNFEGTPATVTADDGGNQTLNLTYANVGSTLNVVAFDRIEAAIFDRLEASFDLRIDQGSRADGLSFAWLNTANYGVSGAGPAFGESPNLASSFGIGFDVYNNGGEGDNTISLHYDGNKIATTFIDHSLLDLASGQTIKVSIQVETQPSGSFVTVSLQAPDGQIVTPIAGTFVEGMVGYQGRAAFGARTGGAASGFQIDNIRITEEIGRHMDDGIVVSGAVALDGSLAVTPLDGMVPASPQSEFRVLSYASRTGDFATVRGIDDPILGLGIEYGPRKFSLNSTNNDPAIALTSPSGLLNHNITSIQVQFNTPIDPDSFGPDDVTIATPYGFVDRNTITIARNFNTQYSISFPALSLDGDYKVSIGPAIARPDGSSMTAAFETGFTIDKTGPKVLSVTPADSIDAPVSSFDVTFDSPIKATTFSPADVWLTQPFFPRIQPWDVTAISPTVFRISFPLLAAPGNYTLSIGPSIFDIAGNPMDQNADGVNGQELLDVFQSPLRLRAPDLTVTQVSGPETAQFGHTVNISYTVRNVNNDPAPNHWQDAIYLSTDGILDWNDRLLQTIPAASLLGPLDANGNPLDHYDRTVEAQLPLDNDSPAGTYYLIVATNSDNGQFEFESSNNTRASAAVSLSMPPLPDLIVSDIQAPIEGLSGQEIQITWTVFNQGTADFTGTLRDSVYLSTDQEVGNDGFFGNFDFTGTIPAGKSIQRTQRIALPIDLEGKRFVIVHTDANGGTFEGTGEYNNVTLSSSAITIQLSPLPNLRVSTVTPPPTAFSSQQTVVEWTVANVGTGPTNASIWYDAVYLSTDDILDDQDLFLGQTVNASYLAPTESYANRLTVTMPRGISGPYRFIVKTDYQNQVYEHSSENDNALAGTVTDTQLTPPADLQVTNVNAPTQAFSGQPLSLSWTVTNTGPGQTLESAWTDYIYMSEDNTLDGGDRFLGQFQRFGILASSSAYTTSSINVNLPIGLTGDFYVFIRTDAFNNVFEHAFEGNNIGFDATPVRIKLTPPPDLAVTTVDAPASALANHTLIVNYRVANDGATITPNSSWNDRLYLSKDTTLDPTSDILLDTRRRYGALDAGNEYNGTFQVTLPQTLSGTYYAFVLTDREQDVFELVRTNNQKFDSQPVVVDFLAADLVVSEFTAPASGKAGSSLLVNYGVKNAGTGDTVSASWTDRVILSTDNVLGNGDDLALGGPGHTGLLNPGESYAATNVPVQIPLSVGTGSYYLFFVADASGSVFEHQKENNNASTPIPISITRLTADLQVSRVTISPQAVQSGDRITISWAVQNFGTVPTNAAFWNDDVYLSTDADLGDGDDYYLGSVQRTNPLGPNGVYGASRTFTLPAEFQGTFQVIVVTDGNHLDGENRVIEGELENNNATIAIEPLKVTQRARPDLRVTQVNAPATGYAGQRISVSWTVENFGPGDVSGSWYDAVYLSLDQNLDSSDQFVGYRNRPQNHANGTYTQTNQEFQVPQGMAGPFYVFVVADAGLVINEGSNETNNNQHDPEAIKISLLPPADLVVGKIEVPANGVPGREVSIEYTVENKGSNPAQGNWTDSLYLSADNQWDVNDLLIGRVDVVADVPGGSSYTRKLVAPAPGVNPGLYHVIVRTDILNYLPELSDANNLKASLDRVDFDAETLPLGVPDEDVLPTGASAFYKVELPAGETVRFTLDSVSSNAESEIFVRYGSMPSRTSFDFAANDPFQADQKLTIPAERSGTYYVLVYRRTGSSFNDGYSLRADLVPFSISKVTATAGGNAGEFTVKIEGAKFASGTDFTLVAPGADGEVYAAIRKTVKDSTTAFVTFDLSFATLGQYTLSATNGNQTTSSPSPFLIQESNGADIVTEIDGATTLRPNRSYSFQLFYANQGNQDTQAPLILVESLAGVPLGLTASTQVAGAPLQILGVSPDGPLGTLRPGSRGSVTVNFTTGSAAQGVGIQVHKVLASDTTEITQTEWETIERSIRPTGLQDNEWSQFWASIRPRIGTTWGQYVQFLNFVLKDLKLPVDAPGNIKELISRLIKENPGYRPNSQVSGTFLDAKSESPVPNAQIAAYLKVDNGYEFRAATSTDSSGKFVFGSLRPGSYLLALDSSVIQYDQDRDGSPDNEAPSFEVKAEQDTKNDPIYVSAVTNEEQSQDSSPALTNDSAGNLHLVWSKAGTLWHAVDRGNGFVEAEPIPGTEGARSPKVDWNDNLLGSGKPGLLIVYNRGEGNDSELFYVVARPGVNTNSLTWSNPIQVNDDSVYDGQAAFSIDANGVPLLVFPKSDMDLEGGDDSDIYFWHEGLQPTFPTKTQIVQLADSFTTLKSNETGDITPLDPFRLRFQNPWVGPLRIPKWVPVIGGTYGGNLRGSITLENALGCNPKGKVEGELSVKLGDYFDTTGSLSGQAAWTTNQKTGTYDFQNAQIQLKADLGIDLPLFPVKIPFIGIVVDIGFRMDGSISGFLGYSRNDLPWAPTSGGGKARIGYGGYAKHEFAFIGLGEWELSLRAISSVNFKWDKRIAEFDKPAWTFTLTGRLKEDVPFLSNGKTKAQFLEFSYTADVGGWVESKFFPKSIDNGNAFMPMGETGLTVGIEDSIGTANDYSSGNVHLVSQNLIGDSAPSISRTETGEMYSAWADENGVALRHFEGKSGTWGPPIVVPNTFGLNNGSVTIEFDKNGNGILVWSQQKINLTDTSSSEEIWNSIHEGGDLMYSRFDSATGTLSAPLPLFKMFGSDQGVSLKRVDGNKILATWVHSEYQKPGVLYASMWDSSKADWTIPEDVATGNISEGASIGIKQGNPILTWTEMLPSSVPDGSAPEVIKASTYSLGTWSAPQLLNYQTLPLAVDQISDNSVNSNNPLETQSLFDLPFSPPKECLDCKLDEPPPPPSCGTFITLDREKCEYVVNYKPCVVQPRDPNDIINPEGFGAEHWISADQKIPYMIRFENAANASAPAQVVEIRQTLDPDLNPSSFRLGSFGFDNQIFEVPENKAFYNTRLDLTQTKGYFVDVTAGIDVANHQAFWTFTTIDPQTGEQPLNANTGFLPINDLTGQGEGFVSYSVRPKSTVETGTRIDAGLVDEGNDFRGVIVFDTEGPILTPSVFNTLDPAKPTSFVHSMPTNAGAENFEVSWEGSDPDNGSGVAYFNIFVKIDNGDYAPWLQNTTLTQSQYVGEKGHRYSFFSVATDNAGNVEDDPLAADSQTTTPGGKATIGNLVWHDSNANGIQDQGEAGLQGVTVNLYRAGDDSLIGTVVTDAQGAYSFAELPLTDQYYVQFVAPAGYGFSPPDQAIDDNLDSDASITTGRTIAFGVVDGDNVLWDAGLFQLGSIGGSLWNDEDGDGLKDDGEGSLEGWRVYLDTNDNGHLDENLNEPSTVTDASGAFNFSGLRPGTYVVAQILPPGWEQTFPGPAGSNSTNGTGFKKTYVFTGSTTELAAPAVVEVNTALSTADCGCKRHTTPSTSEADANGTVVTTGDYHPWADLIELDGFRADTQFAGIDGRGSSVVIIDTGIDVNHQFFGPDANGDGVADRVVYQWDFADRDGDASDRTGHGSHVSSIVGSQDGTYAGLAPGVNIIALKVFGDNGRGYFSYVEQALDWVIQHMAQYNIVAVNLSVGDGMNWASPVTMNGLSDELATLASMDVVTVAAAGNSYALYGEKGLAYPAADPNVLAVGAVWDGDRGGPWSFGSLGTDYTTGADRIVSFSQRDDEIDLFAPGAVIGGANASGGVAWLRGTSMAAPQVTGAAVLAQQIAQGTLGRRLTNFELKSLLRSSGAIVVDGDDENDSVNNTGLVSYRLDVHALSRAVLAYDGSLQGDQTSDPIPGDDVTPPGPQAGKPFRYTVDLAAEQNRNDVVFGDDFVPPEVADLVDATPDPRSTPVDNIEVKFTKEIDVTTIDKSDLKLTRDGLTVSLDGVDLNFSPGSGPKSYRIGGLAAITNQDGVYVLTVTGTGIKTVDGVETIGSASDEWTVDRTAPTVAITSSLSALKIGQSATITFILSEPANDFTADDIIVKGGVLTDFAGSGTVYSATFTPESDYTGIGTIAVAEGSFTDAVGNGNAAALVPVIAIDTVAPTITIESSKSSLKIGQTAKVSIKLSESSNDFTADDIMVTGGTLSGFTGSGTDYSLNFMPSNGFKGLGTISVKSSTFADLAGNENPAGSSLVEISIDTIAPTIKIESSKSSLKIGETSQISFTLSEASSDFTPDDIVVTGGRLSDFAGSGTVYIATFTPEAGYTGTGTVAISEGSFTNAVGNGNDAATLVPVIAIDTVAPTIKIESSKSSLKIGETTKISFTLSGAAGDFNLDDVVVTGGRLSDFAGSGTVYSATFTPDAGYTGTGNIAVAAGSFTNAVGNANDGASLAPVIAIDTVAPTITIESSRSALKIGQTTKISIKLSEPSNDFTADDIKVTGGTLSGFTGSGKEYSATFTPRASFNGSGTISVNSSTFADLFGNQNPAGSSLVEIAIDTIAPTIKIESSKSTLKIGETTKISFTLSEASSDFAPDDIVVTGGRLSEFTGSGVSYTATFTPTEGFTGAGRISIAASKFTDNAGNHNVLGKLEVAIPTDTKAPLVRIEKSESTLRIGQVSRITFKLSEASSNFTSADIMVTGGTLSGFTGSGTRYVAIFTPTPGFNGIGTISVASGKFTDSFGNSNVAGNLATAIAIDTTAPSIKIESTKSSLKVGETATILFSLSKASSNFRLEDVTVEGGKLSAFTGSGTTYHARFTPMAGFTGFGTVSVAAGRFADSVGNVNISGSLSQSITIDTKAPSVSIASSKSTLKIGETATIQFTLSKASNNFGQEDVSATGGTLSDFTGSGTNYRATFTPAPDFTGTGTVSVLASTFTDSTGNQNTKGSLAPSIAIDTKVPTVTIVSTKSTLKKGETATITFTLNKSSSNFGLEDVIVTGGMLSGFTGGGSNYRAEFTPTADFTGSGSVSVAAEKFTDSLGNSNAAASLTKTIGIDTR